MDELPENSIGGEHGVNDDSSYIEHIQPDAMPSIGVELEKESEDPFSSFSDFEIGDQFNVKMDFKSQPSPSSDGFELIANSQASSSSLPAGYNPSREVEKAWTHLQTPQLKAVWDQMIFGVPFLILLMIFLTLLQEIH